MFIFLLEAEQLLIRGSSFVVQQRRRKAEQVGMTEIVAMLMEMLPCQSQFDGLRLPAQ